MFNKSLKGKRFRVKKDGYSDLPGKLLTLFTTIIVEHSGYEESEEGSILAKLPYPCGHDGNQYSDSEYLDGTNSYWFISKSLLVQVETGKIKIKDFLKK